MDGVSVSIMAHPARRLFVDQLRYRLDARVVWDEKQDRWDTGRRSWLAHDTDAEYHVVIQDDAVLCDHFEGLLPQALIRLPPKSPLVLYAGATYRAQMRRIKRASYLVSDRIIWGVGIVLPTRLIPTVIEHGDRMTRGDLRQRKGNYDLRLSHYFEVNRVPVWYTWPSLVDHRDSPSLIAGRNGGRHAYNFAAERRPKFDQRIARLAAKPL